MKMKVLWENAAFVKPLNCSKLRWTNLGSAIHHGVLQRHSKQVEPDGHEEVLLQWQQWVVLQKFWSFLRSLLSHGLGQAVVPKFKMLKKTDLTIHNKPCHQIWSSLACLFCGWNYGSAGGKRCFLWAFKLFQTSMGESRRSNKRTDGKWWYLSWKTCSWSWFQVACNLYLKLVYLANFYSRRLLTEDCG